MTQIQKKKKTGRTVLEKKDSSKDILRRKKRHQFQP